MRILCRLLSVPQNILMDMNDVMFSYIGIVVKKFVDIPRLL